MANNVEAWKFWGRRLRNHLRESDSNLAELAEKMDKVESTLRSWTNGTRQINLSDFFEACQKAGADPAVMLFGHPIMSESLKKQLGNLAVSVFEADPSANPDYGGMITKIKKKSSKMRK